MLRGMIGGFGGRDPVPVPAATPGALSPPFVHGLIARNTLLRWQERGDAETIQSDGAYLVSRLARERGRSRLTTAAVVDPGEEKI